MLNLATTQERWQRVRGPIRVVGWVLRVVLPVVLWAYGIHGLDDLLALI